MPIAAHPGFFGDVSKCSVSIVMIESRSQRMRGFICVGCGGLHKIKIHQPVLVVIEPGHPSSHCLQIVLFITLCRVLKKCDSRRTANVCEMSRWRGSGRRL